MVAAITILDLSKVNVALPSIEDALGVSSIQLQIIVSGYVLPFGWSWFLQGLPLDIIALILAWRILLTPSQTSYARLDLDPVGIEFLERRYTLGGRAALVPLKLFRVSSFRNGTLLATVYFAAMPATFLLTTLYLQLGLGLEPVVAGMVTIGFALTSAPGSWRGGILVERYGRSVGAPHRHRHGYRRRRSECPKRRARQASNI